MKMPARREFFAKLGAIGGLFALAAPAQAQTSPQRRFIKTDFSQSHAYSQAVVTQGGRTVWLAGQTSPPTMRAANRLPVISMGRYARSLLV